MTRPLSLTVTAWIIIALSVEGLITLVSVVANSIFTPGAIHADLSTSTTLFAGGIGFLANLILACLILAGYGWARIVYIGILAVGLLSTLLHHQPIPLALIPGSKIAIFGYFLFRRESNAYFARRVPNASELALERTRPE